MSIEMTSKCTFAFLAADVASAKNFLFLRGTSTILGMGFFFRFFWGQGDALPFQVCLCCFLHCWTRFCNWNGWNFISSPFSSSLSSTSAFSNWTVGNSTSFLMRRKGSLFSPRQFSKSSHPGSGQNHLVGSSTSSETTRGSHPYSFFDRLEYGLEFSL